MKSPITLLVCAWCIVATHAVELQAQPLLRSNDRIAMIGNTFVERARHYGHIETHLLTATGADVANLTFRNLGWSGDSVYGDARSYFGAPKEGRNRLDKIVTELKPTVIMFCYGTEAATSVDSGWTNEPSASEASAAGLENSRKQFAKGYQELIDRTVAAADGSIRQLVFIAPPPLENLGAPLPDQQENNVRLSLFRDTIREIAQQNNGIFIDLFREMGGNDGGVRDKKNALTSNGIHYTEKGYQKVAETLGTALGYPMQSNANAGYSSLRTEVIEKNRLFFHRWRPANETYLYLFRKHEQGQNAKEIPQLDPLIQAKEKTIEQLRQQVLSDSQSE